MALNPMSSVFIKDTQKEVRHTKEEASDDGGRDLSDGAMGQGKRGTIRSWKKQGMDFLLGLSEGAWPQGHLDLRFITSRTARE